MTAALVESTVTSIGRGLRRRPGRCSSPASSLRTGSRRHRISTVFQIPGRRADSLRIGRYTNFLDTTNFATVTTSAFGSIGFLTAASMIVVLAATTVGDTMSITGLACPRLALLDGYRPTRNNQRTLVQNPNRSTTSVEGSSANHACGRKWQEPKFSSKLYLTNRKGR